MEIVISMSISPLLEPIAHENISYHSQKSCLHLTQGMQHYGLQLFTGYLEQR